MGLRKFKSLANSIVQMFIFVAHLSKAYLYLAHVAT